MAASSTRSSHRPAARPQPPWPALLAALFLSACPSDPTPADGSVPFDAADAGRDGDAAEPPVLPPLEFDPGFDDGLAIPEVGAHVLRVLSPTHLELLRIVGKERAPARVDAWDWIDEAAGRLDDQAPVPSDLSVSVDGAPVGVAAVGVRRRVRYAPFRSRDLRVATALLLRLETPVPEGAHVSVEDASGRHFGAEMAFETVADPLRFSPVIHVNQVGYGVGLPKRAALGWYLGTLGELPVTATGFALVDARTSETVFEGALSPRPDEGFTESPTPYQEVLEADFTGFDAPGQYRIVVEGLGASYPFFVHPGVPAGLARTYALGLYHQRCGEATRLPFTRHARGADHLDPAEVPASDSPNWALIQDSDSDFADHQQAGTPRITGHDTLLFPYVNRDPIDVSGGHHDAGDYSKYTINSAHLVHALIFAADAFPGVAAIDALGLPESGDGIGDVLQIARWEADFLARMQDADGGFYFLVYPRTRRYESNVTPDSGDRQVVWPKNTAATAAAVAALAQAASSPAFRAAFPEAAADYLRRARDGWDFLEAAFAAYGEAGSYQKLTHYGNQFRHDDEIAWAAAELFLATGEERFHDRLRRSMPDPRSPELMRWGWWRLVEGWGNAVRSYAFASISGRMEASRLDAAYQTACQDEVVAAGADQLTRASASAYGTSLPLETRRFRAAGWYFSSEQTFDIVAARQLDPRPGFLAAVMSNLDYEAGANPVNVSYLTGVGFRQPRDIVHQHAQNDRRALPPAGIPQGNVVSGFQWGGPYDGELGALSFPLDGSETGPYPMYDRWGDSFNVTAEFVVPQLGRALGVTAALMAAGPSAPGRTRAEGRIVGLSDPVIVGEAVELRLEVDDLSLTDARIVWDGFGIEPAMGRSFRFVPTEYGPQVIEAEAVWPDGHRVVASRPIHVLDRSDAVRPTLTAEATVPVASRATGTAAQIVVLRTGALDGPLSVRFGLYGSAGYGTDYDHVGGNYWDPWQNTATFEAGADRLTIAIRPRPHDGVPGRTVTLVLQVGDDYRVGEPGVASAVIDPVP